MADIAVTLDRVRLLDTTQRCTSNVRAGEAITRGQPVYEKPDGTVAKARANAVGTAKVCGIATNDAGPGEPLTVLERGRLVGFDLSGVDNGATVFLSSVVAGAIADEAPSDAGNAVVPLGAVKTMTGSGNQKYILFDISQAFVPEALA